MERLSGVVTVELYAAFPERILNACAAETVDLFGLERRDACTLRASLHEAQLGLLLSLAERQHAQLRILSRTGGSRLRAFLRRRTALLLSFGLGFSLLALSSLFIWEIDVDGCKTLSRAQVLRTLASCGVYEGVFWPGLSQDGVRSQMLQKCPELAWMTVNVSGSRALVTVIERTEPPEIYREEDAAELAAAKSGVVAELCILNGRPLVHAGDAVLTGETLVTGRMESIGGQLRYVRASGTVVADTWYELTATVPNMSKKGEVQHTLRRFALVIGKKRMFFSPGSRKELDGYDKIVHEYKLGVKGLFRFPVSFIIETYQMREHTVAAEAETNSCIRRLREMLEEQMQGEILQFRVSTGKRRGLLCLTVRAHCRENIAETVKLSP